MKHLLLLAALWGTLSAGDKTTKPDTLPTFTSRTSLVLVPTVVTDKRGASITGLTKEDFTLFEEGHARPIAVFEELNTAEPRLRVQDTANGIYSNEIAVDSKEQRFTMIVFDLLNTRFEDQVRGRRDLLRFFENTLQPNEPLALSVLGPSGLTVITEFSTDPKALAAALQRVRNQPTFRERSLSLDGSRESIEDNVAQGERSVLSNSLDSRLDSFILSQMDTMDARDARRALSLTLLSMKQIGELFAGVPGRKTLIWVTGALPSMQLTMNDLGENSDIQKEYAAAWDALSRSQVVVYPMDMGGLFDSGFISARFGRPPRYRMTMDDTASNLEHFAKMTGGKLCIYKMNIPDCYREAKADAAHYYLLGYYADFSKLKPGWRRLDVRVRRNDLRVRAREGVFVNAQQQKRGEREEILTAIVSPVNFTAIPLAIHVDPKGIHRQIQKESAPDPKTKQETAVIPFQFYVPGTSILVDKANHNHIDISLAAFAKDSKGTIKGEFSRKIEGDLSEQGVDDLRKTGILFNGEMTAPLGSYNIRFIVRDNTSSQMGSLNFSLDTAERETVANTPHP